MNIDKLWKIWGTLFSGNPSAPELEDARVHRLELFSICHGSGIEIERKPE